MLVSFVRFSRPLLIRTDQLCDGSYFYQTIYGFAQANEALEDQAIEIENYLGYLAGMHDWSNGGDNFTIIFDQNRIPNWLDQEGNRHIEKDDWMIRKGKQCV